MKIIIDIHNKNTNAFGKMPLAKLREQFNIPTELVAKKDGKILQDIASVENHDEIIFTKPEMITICVSLEVNLPEGSTVAELIKLINENLMAHGKLQALSRGRILNISHRLGNESGIEFIDTKA